MKEHQRRIVDYLRKEGCTGIHFTNGGKHPKVNFTHNGKGFRLPVACSPSDDHAHQNAIAKIRRLLHPLREESFSEAVRETTADRVNEILNDGEQVGWWQDAEQPMPESDQPETETNASSEIYRGTVASYTGGLFFQAPVELVDKLGEYDFIEVDIVDETLYQLRPVRGARMRPRFLPDKSPHHKRGFYRLGYQPRKSLRMFGATPADFDFDNGVVLAFLTQAPKMLRRRQTGRHTPPPDVSPQQVSDNLDKILRMLKLADDPELLREIVSRVGPDDALDLAEKIDNPELRNILVRQSLAAL